MKYEIVIPGLPVLLNDIMRTSTRHQSRLKLNGKRHRKTKEIIKFGYKQLDEYFKDCPKFDKPIALIVQIFQTRKSPIDIDAVNKTLLDYLGKHAKIIIDDNHKGINGMLSYYAEGFYDKKQIKVSIIS